LTRLSEERNDRLATDHTLSGRILQHFRENVAKIGRESCPGNETFNSQASSLAASFA
jgi:hypothetical protein